jgi:Uma2 family endonuclease
MTLRTVLSADGRLRRAFTVKDVERMVEVGLIDPDERLEIVAGEIMPMSPKGARHEVLKIALLERLFDQRSPDCRIAVEPGWRLGEMLYLEPDMLVYPAAVGFASMRGRDALLVVEIADSTLGTDLGPKAALYAAEGVRDYWVINAATHETHIHRDPGPNGYGTVQVVGPEEEAAAALIPFKVRISELSE